MKRILLALTMVGLLLPLAPRAEAETEVSLNFFYDNLSPYGNWIDVADYGYCFQPNVAVGSSDWRPYADGYWAYTDAGWTWVSYEDFGWATYHYGRWAELDNYGWVWVPGYDWGPAWVSWRTGGDYVGWAPLPPQGGGVVYEGRAITGAVDVTFGIGPLYYNFVDIRYIGEPVLRGRLIPRSRNVTIINNTVNVTNITYNNTTVINHGPDLNRVNQYSTRPIQRLTLQRETNISADVAGRRGNLNRVNGNTLMVAAPAVQKSQQKLAPKQVKAKVEKPKLEKGWQGINNRQQVEQEMKKEGNAQNVPPPTFQPRKGRKGEAAGAQPNDNTGAAGQGAAAENDREAAKAARQAAQENRGQNAGKPEQPNANGNAEQASKSQKERNAQEQRGQQAEQRRAERAQKAQESETQPDSQKNDERTRRVQEQQAQQEQSNQQESQRARMKQERARNAAPDQSQGSQAAERRQRAVTAEESQRANRAEQAQQSQRPERTQRPERAQRPEEAQRPERAQRPEEAQRPERAQRPPESRRPEQARPQEQQNNPNPDQERRGKKNKPNQEPTPQG